MEFCLHTPTRLHSDSRDWAGIASVFSVFPHAMTSAAAALMLFFSSLTLCEGRPAGVRWPEQYVSDNRPHHELQSNKGAEDE
jgi:hypothetical protein